MIKTGSRPRDAYSFFSSCFFKEDLQKDAAVYNH